MPVTAVYAGSFDPPTNGHVWMIQQGAALFDRLVVATGTNPDKRYNYPLAQRMRWLKVLCQPFDNVELTHFENLFLARYAESIGARVVIRGIRNEADYAFERAMRHINGDLHPGLTTVFLLPPRELVEISSSMVKGLIGPSGWQDVVRQYVPEAVFRDLLAEHP